MIFDSIENARSYYSFGDKFEKAFEFILNNDLKTLSCGRHDIAEGIYANVCEVDLKMAHLAKFEAHRKYIDIQYVISGCERMDFSLIDNFRSITAYDGENDIEFLELKEESPCANSINVREGNFAIFFPHDVHSPMLSCADGCEKVKKVIVKIKAG